MLFEKIPFLYGSGIILNKFQVFKKSIKDLVMNEFFSDENIESFLSKANNDSDSQLINADRIFDEIKMAIMESSFGGMLAMFGGDAALEPLKEPIKQKINKIKNDLGSQILGKDEIKSRVDGIISSRMENLTAQDIKIMIQNVIKEHLGWLVVWGGVFGGLIGLLFKLL